jgi:hypothetical protein
MHTLHIILGNEVAKARLPLLWQAEIHPVARINTTGRGLNAEDAPDSTLVPPSRPRKRSDGFGFPQI